MATSYANNSGTGERRPEIIVTTDLLSSAGDLGGGVLFSSEDIAVLIDGVTGAGGREPGVLNNGVSRFIKFDWNVGAEGGIVIDEFKFYAENANSYGTWTFDGSDNGSSWTTLTTITLTGNSGAAQVYSFANSTGYRYYRLNTTSMSGGGGGGGFWREVEFKIEDITPQSTRPSWFNTNGFGNRASAITTSTTLSLAAGVIANVVDGDYTNNSTHAIGINSGQSSKEIKFDFGGGATNTIIDTVVIWQDSSSLTHGTWKLQGSPDNSTWTDVGSTFPLTGSGYNLNIHQIGNTVTGYRYYRLLQTAGTTNGAPNITEIEFRIKQGGGGATSIKSYKTTQYAVLQSSRDIRAYKATQYAVLEPPPPILAYKVTQYAVLEPLVAAIRSPKVTMYLVLAPPPPIKSYKVTQYAILAPPPPANIFDELTTFTNVIPSGAFTHYFLQDFSTAGDTSPRFMLLLFGKKAGDTGITRVNYLIQDFSTFYPFSVPPEAGAAVPESFDLGSGFLASPVGSIITLRDAVWDGFRKRIGLFLEDSAGGAHYVLYSPFLDAPVAASVSTSVPFPNNTSFNARRANVSLDYRYISDDSIVKIEPGTLNVAIDSRTVSGVGAPAYAGAQYYDGARRAISYVDVNGDITTIYTERYSSKNPTLDKILRRVLLKAGIAEEFFDVSGVAGIDIEGYMVRDQSTALDVVKELVDFFHINMVDSSGRLVFTALSTASNINVDANHFHHKMTTRAIDAIDDITSAEVTYYDIGQDDNTWTQIVNRDAFTDVVDYVANSIPVTYKAAVFTTGARARQSAEVYLFKSTQHLDSRKIWLAPYHLAAEPGDMIGENFRIKKLTLDVTLEMAVEAVTDATDNYVNTDLAAPDILSFVDTTLKDYDHGTKNFPVCFPLNPNKFGALLNTVYVGVVNPDPTDFVPTLVQMPGQGSYPIRLGTPTGELVYGRVISPPDAGRRNMFTTDYSSRLIIGFNKTVPGGVLATVADIATNWKDVTSNLLLVGRELLQYKTAVIAVDGKTVTFTGLTRGMFGTDEFANAHTIGEAAAVYNVNRMLVAEIPPQVASIGMANFTTFDKRAPQISNSEDVQIYDAISRSWSIARLNAKKVGGDGVHFRCVTRLPYANGFLKDEDPIVTSYGQTAYIAILRAPFNLTTFLANFTYIPTLNYATNPYIARLFATGTRDIDLTGATGGGAVYNVLNMATDGFTLTSDLWVAAFILDLADSQSVLKSPVRGFLFEGGGHYDTFKTGLDA